MFHELGRLFSSIVFRPLINHKRIVVVSDCVENSGGLIQDLLDIWDYVDLANIAFEETKALGLIEDCLCRVIREVDICIRYPFADSFFIGSFDVEVAEDLTRLNNGHQGFLSLLRQVRILVVTPVNELLLDLIVCQIF